MSGPEHTPADAPARAGRSTYAGLALTSMAVLLDELILTRIFSVTTWYHFAFMAVAVAMFGMTAGALLVYLAPGRFPAAGVHGQLGRYGTWFGITMTLALLTHLIIPFVPRFTFVHLFAIAFTCLAIALPFGCGGVVICLALTRFPGQVSKLYAADLVGAAAGCALLPLLLGPVDAPSAVMLASALAAAAGLLFFRDAPNARRGRLGGWVAVIGLLALAGANITGYHLQSPLVRFIWIKERPAIVPRYQRWNSFSYIWVFGDPERSGPPVGWGLSGSCVAGAAGRQLHLQIDSAAGTRLIHYAGDPKEVEWLGCDVTNLAYRIRTQGRVLIVGAGGGRDVLSALTLGESSVTAVEINRDIIRAVNGVYGDFTGHLDRDPRVRFVNDEARSWLTRTPERFDVIEVSLIDTWAATASGAYVLTENSLYTVEAWRLMLSRLTPSGVLSFSRWYYRDRPGEAYRLTALAAATLRGMGIADARAHLILVRIMDAGGDEPGPDGVGTLLVSREPFSADDVEAVRQVAERLGFEVMLDPHQAADPVLERIVSEPDPRAFYAAFPLNIAPPTDDQPFFFNMLRLRDVFRPRSASQGLKTYNLNAVAVLGALLIIVVVLCLTVIVVPLALTAGRGALAGGLPLAGYFLAIGFGFMLVELSQLQRLIIFLGHPTYGLAVVLFALLLSSGLGSLSTAGIGAKALRKQTVARLLALPASLILLGLLTPAVTAWCGGASTPARIAVSAALLGPAGFFMGMAFPLGMRAAHGRSGALTPWLWGLNGAASVCASVVEAAVAMGLGVRAAFALGVGCYALAAALMAAILAREKNGGRSEA